MYLKSIGKKLNVKIIIPHIGAIMNNHNIIKKIIDYIPKKVYIISVRQYYKNRLQGKKGVLNVCATMDKALDRLTTHILDYINVGTEHMLNDSSCPEIFYQIVSAKKPKDFDEIRNFLDKLNKTMINECINEKHDDFIYESCKKTETYLRTYSIMRKYISEHMSTDGYFTWNDGSCYPTFSVTYKITEYIPEQ